MTCPAFNLKSKEFRSVQSRIGFVRNYLCEGSLMEMYERIIQMRPERNLI